MGNTGSETCPGRSAGPGKSNGLDRVREVAVRDKEARFTALLHHVTFDRLWAAFASLREDAAPGVDGVRWAEYAQDLESNLRDLHARVQSGRYRATPVRRVHIPKPDGRLRPLGVATVTSYCLSCSRVSECSGLAAVRPCCRICWHEHGKWYRHFSGRLSGGGAWCAGLRG